MLTAIAAATPALRSPIEVPEWLVLRDSIPSGIEIWVTDRRPSVVRGSAVAFSLRYWPMSDLIRGHAERSSQAASALLATPEPDCDLRERSASIVREAVSSWRAEPWELEGPGRVVWTQDAVWNLDVAFRPIAYGLAPGVFKLEASPAPALALGVWLQVATGEGWNDTKFDVALADAARIRVAVRDIEGNAIPDSRVSVGMQYQPSWDPDLHAENDGIFSLTAPALANVEVQASAPGFGSKTVGACAFPGDELPVAIVLRHLGSVRVHITRPDGLSSERWKEALAGVMLDAPGGWHSADDEGAIDCDAGTVTFSAVPEGSVLAELGSEWMCTARSRSATVAPDATTELHLDLNLGMDCRVHVVDADGVGVSALTVIAIGGPDRVYRRATTDAAGIATIEGLAEGEPYSFELYPTDDGAAEDAAPDEGGEGPPPMTYEHDGIAARPEITLVYAEEARLTLHVTAPGWTDGPVDLSTMFIASTDAAEIAHVLAAQSRPEPGPLWESGDRDSDIAWTFYGSSPDGIDEFALPNGEAACSSWLRPGKGQLVVSAPGYAASVVPLDLHPGERRSLSVPLEPLGSLNIHVAFPGDAPLPGPVAVLLRLDEPTRSSWQRWGRAYLTNDDGDLHITGLERLRYVVSLCNGASAIAELRAASSARVALTSEPFDRAVVGRVLGSDGHPIAGCDVGVSCDVVGEATCGERRTRTDNDGVFRMDGLARGAVQISAGANGEDAYARVLLERPETRIELRLASRRRDLLDVIEEQRTEFMSQEWVDVVLVVQSAGRPMPGVTLSVWNGKSWASETTGADGRVVMSQLTAGVYDVKSPVIGEWLRDEVIASVTVVAGEPVQRFVIEIPRCAYTFRRAGGTGAETGRIRILSAKDGDEDWRLDSPDNDHPLSGVLPIAGGRYWVAVAFDGFAPVRLRATFTDGVVFDVTAPPSCSLRVRADVRDGSVTDNVVVLVCGAGSASPNWIRSRETANRYRWDPDAPPSPLAQTVDGLAPGTYDVCVFANTLDNREITLCGLACGVKVEPDSDASVVVTLLRSVAVRIVVRNAAGDRVDHVEVFAHMTAFNGRPIPAVYADHGSAGFDERPGETILHLAAGGTFSFTVSRAVGSTSKDIPIASDCDVCAVTIPAGADSTIEITLAE